jgi:hypothetical protein
MKIYVPKNHNKLLLSSIGYGECFWVDEELYIKVSTPFHNVLKSLSAIYAVRLRDGVLFDFTTCPIVLMESNVAIFESGNKNE